MKHLFISLTAIAALVLSSCSNSGSNGELVGVYTQPYYEQLPFGMNYIPSGSFTMGPNDQNSFFVTSKQNKQINIEKFWMDETEITNNEYKQFAHWLREYLTRLAIFQQDIGPEAEQFAQLTREGDVVFVNEEQNIPKLDWDMEIDSRDPDIKEFLDTMFYHREIIPGTTLKISKFNYTYIEIDLVQAAKKINMLDPVTARYKTKGRTSKDLLRRDTAYIDGERGIVRETKYIQLSSRDDFFITRCINIYPDTLCWMRHYTYSYNEPYTLYFSHPGYAEYPVVGVSWEQAKAFCNWRSSLRNNFLRAVGEPNVQPYRLPTEAEWEYAARGGKLSSMYPWGGPYIRRKDGCFLANFKPGKGNYIKDGFNIPAYVGAFPANDFGLFDMAGNVSEWTNDAYLASGLSVVNELNASFAYDAKNDDPLEKKKKVIKGGSWKDVGAFLQCGVQSSEYQHATLPYLGFRCVRTVISDKEHLSF